MATFDWRSRSVVKDTFETLFGSVQKKYLKDLVKKTTDYTDTGLTLEKSVSVYEQETP